MAAAVVGGLVLGGVTAPSAFAATAAKPTTKTTTTTKSTVRATAKKAAANKAAANKAAAKKATAKKATAKKAATKTVVYHGYELQVPASWPVYRLDQHPTTCVRYDVHAVYLGTPGTDMQCPAGLAGRTQTVSVIPSTTVAAGSGTEITDQREQPDGVGGTDEQSLSAVHGTVTLNTAQRELRVELGAASLGATVLATYGTDPAVVEQVLSTLRTAPAGAPETAQTAPPSLSQPSGERASVTSASDPAASAPAAAVARPATAGQPKAKKTEKARKTKKAATTITTSWHGLPAGWPTQIVQPQPPAAPRNGFDSCTAPSLATLKVWRKQYSAVGIYIGGDNDACAFGNLSASWISSAAAMGWGMLPVYVGPQSPCWDWTGAGIRIDPSAAAAEGVTAGEYAVADAKIFGLAPGAPVYDDMEAYNADNASCVRATMTFIGAWDRTVNAAGYLTGVYSSQDSGIVDLQAALTAKMAGFTPPDAIWIALWDGVATLTDGKLSWPADERSKQYAGNTSGTVGGITLSIDKDIVGGPVAR